jgi:hypothetical protein
MTASFIKDSPFKGITHIASFPIEFKFILAYYTVNQMVASHKLN